MHPNVRKKCCPEKLQNWSTRFLLHKDTHVLTRRQLPPLIFSKLTQKIWARSIMAMLRARGHTTTRLNIEYLSHSALYAPTSQVFYKGTVQSFQDTALYAPPLNKLVQSLPRAILQDDSTVFRLPGYTHFLDVSEGKCVYALGGSSENALEARTAISLVRGLLATVPGYFFRIHLDEDYPPFTLIYNPSLSYASLLGIHILCV